MNETFLTIFNPCFWVKIPFYPILLGQNSFFTPCLLGQSILTPLFLGQNSILLHIVGSKFHFPPYYWVRIPFFPHIVGSKFIFFPSLLGRKTALTSLVLETKIQFSAFLLGLCTRKTCTMNEIF